MKRLYTVNETFKNVKLKTGSYGAGAGTKLGKQPQGCGSHGFEITDVISVYYVGFQNLF